MLIQYFANKQINKSRWDECIYNSLNGTVYATSWYLDYISDDWSALILGDYEYVMPLTIRKKWGIHYIYLPHFVQQLGIFSKAETSEKIVSDFITAIPTLYKFCHLQLNTFNPVIQEHTKRKNYLLYLNDTYENLKKNYSRSANRNIKKALTEEYSIQEYVDPQVVINIHQKKFKKVTNIKNKNYQSLINLAQFALKNGYAYSVGVINDQKEIIASSIYLIYKNRIVFIINGNLPAGLRTGASHFLKDFVIRKFSNSNYIMDFEGSDNPAFARFYEQFGNTQIEYYATIKINRLPWPINLWKK